MPREIEPMVGEDGEVRPLSALDLATFERGAPWTRSPAEAAREPLREAINALSRAEGEERARVAGALGHLRSALEALEGRDR